MVRGMIADLLRKLWVGIAGRHYREPPKAIARSKAAAGSIGQGGLDRPMTQFRGARRQCGQVAVTPRKIRNYWRAGQLTEREAGGSDWRKGQCLAAQLAVSTPGSLRRLPLRYSIFLAEFSLTQVPR